MKQKPAPGLVVRDRHGRIGIAWRVEGRPDQGWIDEQIDHRVSQTPMDSDWWSILVLGGGVVLEPEPLMTVLRPATYEDFLEAIDHSSQTTRRELAELFPDFARAAMRSARGVR